MLEGSMDHDIVRDETVFTLLIEVFRSFLVDFHSNGVAICS